MNVDNGNMNFDVSMNCIQYVDIIYKRIQKIINDIQDHYIIPSPLKKV